MLTFSRFYGPLICLDVLLIVFAAGWGLARLVDGLRERRWVQVQRWGAYMPLIAAAIAAYWFAAGGWRILLATTPLVAITLSYVPALRRSIGLIKPLSVAACIIALNYGPISCLYLLRRSVEVRIERRVQKSPDGNYETAMVYDATDGEFNYIVIRSLHTNPPTILDRPDHVLSYFVVAEDDVFPDLHWDSPTSLSIAMGPFNAVGRQETQYAGVSIHYVKKPDLAPEAK